MKKSVLVLLLFLSLLFISCEVEVHIHTFSEKWSYDDNYHWHASTCEHPEEISEKAEHTWETKINKAATCTEKGSITYTCSVCGAVKTEQILAKGHNKDIIISSIPASCESAGSAVWRCSACGTEYTEGIPALGHNWKQTSKVDAQGCTDGSISYACAREGCNANKTEVIKASLSHTLDAGFIVNESTCTEEGKEVHTCQICGQIVEIAIPKIPHSDEVTLYVAPTCTEYGKKVQTCTVCGRQIEMLSDPLGHKASTDLDNDNEKHWKYCVRCGEPIGETTKEHTFYNGKCTGCLYSESLDAISVGDSIQFGRYYKTNAGEYGVITWKVISKDGLGITLLCDNIVDCKQLNEASELDSWENASLRQWLNDTFFYSSFSEFERTKMNAVGFCSTTDKVTVLSNTEIVGLIKAGILTSRYTAPTAYASTQGNSRQMWLRTLVSSTKALACDSNGSVMLNGYSITLNYGVRPVISIGQHRWNEGEITEAPTCEKQGIITYTCLDCAVVEEKVIEPTGHSWNEGEITIPQTYNIDGEKTYTCLNCGSVKKEILPSERSLFYSTFSVGKKGPAGGYIFYDCDADNDDGNTDGLTSSECGWRFLEAASGDLRLTYETPQINEPNILVITPEGVTNTIEIIFGYYCPEATPVFVNGTKVYDASNCTSVLVGTGRRNTDLLVSAMGEEAYQIDPSIISNNPTTACYAARLCDILSYSYNGKTYDDWFLPSKSELDLMYSNLKVNNLGGFASAYYWSSSEVDGAVGSAYYLCFGGNDHYVYTRLNSLRVRPIRAF